MRTYKTIVILISLPAILYSAVGNIYVFLFTYRELNSRIKDQYGGKLKIAGYEYNSKNDICTFIVQDEDGMNADFVYEGAGNTFADGYKYISSRVSYYTLRGNVLKKIRSCGIIPQDVDITYESKTHIIGEISDIDTSVGSVCVTVEAEEKNAFCECAETLIRVLAESDIGEITVRSDKFVITVTDGMIPCDKNGFLFKIRAAAE